MSTPHHDPEDFDWTAAESDLGEVVDLDAARTRRAGTPTTDPNADEIEPDDTDDTEAAGPVLVDSIDAQRRPRLTLSGFRDAHRVPIVPTWLKSSREFGGNLAWATGFGLHSLAYHGLRTPK
jgi:S-DNA-T family DNA segregation ATPase FtsK/SpoIIIE